MCLDSRVRGLTHALNLLLVKGFCVSRRLEISGLPHAKFDHVKSSVPSRISRAALTSAGLLLGQAAIGAVGSTAPQLSINSSSIVATTVPETATFLMVGAGLIMFSVLGNIIRRRRTANVQSGLDASLSQVTPSASTVLNSSISTSTEFVSPRALAHNPTSSV